jgi:hypothetical protein
MEYKTEILPLNKIDDAFSGVNLGDVTATLLKKLTRDELLAYSYACMKVSLNEKLTRADVILFNKIDAISMQAHGICLKDSKVTKARLSASVRYGIC